jgi:tetratricopeptide (TPR) repeat protein
MGRHQWHFSEQQASGLVANTLTIPDRNRAVQHLLAGCESCRTLIANALSVKRSAPRADLQPVPAMASHAATAMPLGGEAGQLAWSEIEGMPAAERLAAVKADPRLHRFGVFQAALEAARREAQREPRAAVEMAHLALALAELVDPEIQPSHPLRSDWRGEALLALAHAKRTAGDFPGARSALNLAEDALLQGTEDQTEMAMLQVQRARLSTDLGDFEKAVEQLDAAATLFRRAGNRIALGKVLLHQAVILRQIEPAQAITLAEEGSLLIDRGSEPRAELSSVYTRAYSHNELGNADEAERLLESSRFLLARFDDAATRASLEWLAARIRARQGRTAEAERRLREVRDRYLAADFRLEAVLSTVELIELIASQGRTGEALDLAREVLPVLQSWRLHRDVIALVTLLVDHLQRKTAEAGLYKEVADRLRRSWHLNEVGGRQG